MQGLASVIVLVLALGLTFGLVSFMYYVVPKGHVPWHGVWPGAIFVTATTAIGNAVFPVYLTSISDIDKIGGALGFHPDRPDLVLPPLIGNPCGSGDQRTEI